MPRDPAKLKKADLVAELREKHGVEAVEFVVAEPEGFGKDGFEMPAEVEVRYVPDPDHVAESKTGTRREIVDEDNHGDAIFGDVEVELPPDPPPLVPEFVEVVPLDDAAGRLSVAELAGMFSDRLDTTTEKEREKAARTAVERENEQAEAAAAYAEENAEPEPNDETPGERAAAELDAADAERLAEFKRLEAEEVERQQAAREERLAAGLDPDA